MAFDDILALTFISIMAALTAIAISLWHAWKYECRVSNMADITADGIDDAPTGGGH